MNVDPNEILDDLETSENEWYWPKSYWEKNQALKYLKILKMKLMLKLQMMI